MATVPHARTTNGNNQATTARFIRCRLDINALPRLKKGNIAAPMTCPFIGAGCIPTRRPAPVPGPVFIIGGSTRDFLVVSR